MFMLAALGFVTVLLAQAAPAPIEPAVLVERLSAAETSRNSSAASEALLQLTDRLGTADLSTVAAAVPAIVRAADDPDADNRSLAMLALTAVTGRTGSDHSLSGDALPLLEPHLPVIAKHLQDPDLAVRQVAVLVLGGFQPHPVSGAIDPLVASLQAADAPTTIGLGATVALLKLGIDSPAHPEIAAAVLRFVERTDLPPSLRSKLFSAIALAPAHSEALDTGLLGFLGAKQTPAVRSALIALLPKLRLKQKDVDSTRVVLTKIAASASEDRSVRTGAVAVLSCWHGPQMTNACPALPMRYRMVAPPKPVAAPRYQSPPLF